MLQPQSTLLSVWRLLKFTDGTPKYPTRSLTCSRTKLISMHAVQWFSMVWLKSKTRWIQHWPSADHVAREFVEAVPWTSEAPTHWLALARSTTPISTNLWRSILYLTCTWSRISFQTWPTSTISIVQFNHGCSERKCTDNAVDLDFRVLTHCRSDSFF